MEKGIKKKVFKTAIIATMKNGNEEFTVDDAILESAIAKHGRNLRKDTGEVNWNEKDVSVVIGYYDNYGKKPETIETAKEEPPVESAMKTKKSASVKKPSVAVVKPMKNSGPGAKTPATVAKKSAAKKSVKKPSPKKKGTAKK